MKQSKRMSLLESVINIGVGFGISLVAQMIFLPMIGVPINHTQNFIFACIMTVISLARSFLLRRLFEALHIRTPLSPFMRAVNAERERQQHGEGWSHEHDDSHAPGQLALAGASYCLSARYQMQGVAPTKIKPPACWPWGDEWWKPTGFRRDLVKAAALVVAEGERFDRLKTKSKAAPSRLTGDAHKIRSGRLELNRGQP